MNRGIQCESGSSFIGLTVLAGISIWNEECFAFMYDLHVISSEH